MACRVDLDLDLDCSHGFSQCPRFFSQMIWLQRRFQSSSEQCFKHRSTFIQWEVLMQGLASVRRHEDMPCNSFQCGGCATYFRSKNCFHCLHSLQLWLGLGQFPRMANSFRPVPGDCPVNQSKNPGLLRLERSGGEKTFANCIVIHLFFPLL